MNKKLKLALAALLGFSAACSSVKNAPRQSETQGSEQAEAEGDTLKLRRIIVMYGVRPPQGGSVVTPLSEAVEAERAAARMGR